MKLRFAIFSIFLLSSITILAQKNSIPFQESADNYLAFLSQGDRFKGSVAFAKNGRIIYENTFGNNVPSFTSIPYRIGSVSKVFTAIVIYQLIEEGKLNESTRLSGYFPEIKYANDITIEQLLSHTSGIFNISERPDFSNIQMEPKIDRKRHIELIRYQKPEFKPGKGAVYSNSNYILLGYIIEDITGQKYEDVIKERIISKIGLTETKYDTSELFASKLVSSATFTGFEWIPTASCNADIAYASGGIVSSAPDLCRFMNALNTGQLVSTSSLQKMKTLVNRSIGHGLHKMPFYEKVAYGHTGRIDDYHTVTLFFPEDSLSMTMCTNGLNYNFNEITISLLSFYYGKEVELPSFRRMELSPDSIRKYVGTYKLRLFRIIPILTMEIETREDLIYIQVAEEQGERTYLEPLSSDLFISYLYGNKIQFLEKNGKVKGLYLMQGSSRIFCKKKKNKSTRHLSRVHYD